MDIDTALLRRTGLFQDMEDGDIRRLLDCLHCPVRRYGRGEFLWHAGDAVPMAGIVLEGCVDAVQYGEDGGAVLTARQEKGGVFGDLLMAAGQASPLSLVASAEGAAVLFLPLEGILSDCGRGCACHVALRRNLLAETASKFWGLRQRVAYLTEPSCGGASCCSCGTGGRRRAATISACPTPVRRWRRYWASTAAPCPVSWDGCSGRGCWNSTAAASG